MATLNEDNVNVSNEDYVPTWEEAFDLVLELEKAYRFLALEDTGELLIYNKTEGVYSRNAESFIKKDLQHWIPRITSHLVNEVITKLKQRHYVSRSEFDKSQLWLHLNNCWLNLETLKVEPHGDDVYSLQKLPVDYDPNATCPNFVKFLRETLEPRYIGIVVKILGYILYKKSFYHKAFMFTGEGANGKSTLIGVIEAFVGKHNRSNVSLQDLTGNRFKMAELYGKMVNLYADLPSEKIANTGTFKMLVSGDSISAERKYEQSFSFENYAKIIVSANQIPKSDDKTYAYMRRWVIIPFNRVFEGDNADEQLLEKLTTKEELSGILNLALKGLRKLKAEHGFNEVDIEELRRQYEVGSSRIHDFISERCELKPESDDYYVESATLREEFRKYCREKGTNYFDERKFGEDLKTLGIRHKQKGSRQNRVYFDFGIRIKSSPVLKSLDKSPNLYAEFESKEERGER